MSLPYVDPVGGRYGIYDQSYPSSAYSVVRLKSSSPLGLQIVWDGRSYLELSVPAAFRRAVCGLCGRYNYHGDSHGYGYGVGMLLEIPSPRQP